MNSHCLKLYRAYSILLNSLNVGKFLCSGILKDCIKVQEKKKKIVVLCSRPHSTKREISCGRSQNFIRLLRVVITPSDQLRGENDSKQSDEFQAIVVVQRRLRNVPKTVIHVQNSLCYFANLNMSKLMTFFAVLAAVAVIAPYEHVT